VVHLLTLGPGILPLGKSSMPVVIDLRQEYAVGEVRYLARQDQHHGRIGEYRIYTRWVPLGGL